MKRDVTTTANPVSDLDEQGFAIVPEIIPPEAIAAAAHALEALPLKSAGTRNLLALPWCRAMAKQLADHARIAAALPSMPVAIQCTLFDKTQETNWLVALHQDLTIPVRERCEHPALGVWSLKEGHHFVQAPTDLLAQLLAVRVHIDDCDADNGPLRVVPGSHRHGRLSDIDAWRQRETAGEIACTARRGDALLFRPLLLHASSKALAPGHRRVLHFLFGPRLPGYGLQWQLFTTR